MSGTWPKPSQQMSHNHNHTKLAAKSEVIIGIYFLSLKYELIVISLSRQYSSRRKENLYSGLEVMK